MAETSKIEWTEATWNPIAGCSVVSPGCTNCYAMRRVAPRLSENPATPHYHGTVQPSKGGYVWTGKIGIASDKVFMNPLTWKKPRMIFVNSTSDLFHENVPDDVIDRVFAIMALCPQHTFQVLTKRPGRMRSYCATIQEYGRWLSMEQAAIDMGFDPRGADNEGFDWISNKQFLPNVWLGTSVEDQTRADERIPNLLETPAAVRFISAEPLLGPVDLTEIFTGWSLINALEGCKYHDTDLSARLGPSTKTCRLDWVIVGGESGKGARRMDPDWARSIRSQCEAAEVPFFMKQMSGETKRDMPPIPEYLAIRQYPNTKE